jgi:NADH-quinone oxidoreductase subunit H
VIAFLRQNNFEIGPCLARLFALLRAWAEAHGVPPVAAHGITMLVQTSVLIGLISLVPIILVYAERKVSAFMQARLGPMETGPYGILQTIADGIKLFFKEDIVPQGADRWIHWLAPVAACAPAFICFAPVPFGRDIVPVDLDTGVLFILAISGLSVIGILMGGWGSGNKYSMLGGVRAAAQLVSYEIPRVLSVVPILMLYGTQNLRLITMAQQARWFNFFPKWFVFYPVIGQISFLIFLICSVAETNRTPFDIPEAESELVAGFHTEFSGLKFAFFFLAEYAYVFLASAMAAALFFGGGDGLWVRGGIIPSWLWFLAKTSVLVFVFLWFRWTYPRLRVDRLMQFCWKFLLPWSFINIALTGAWVLVH